MKSDNNNFAVGTDIETISRFRKFNNNINDPFLTKVFTKGELTYCLSTKNPAQHLAVRYAGKEATIKALGGLGKKNLEYKDIEIIRADNGVPKLSFTNKNMAAINVSISLSHCQDYAIATVIINF